MLMIRIPLLPCLDSGCKNRHRRNGRVSNVRGMLPWLGAFMTMWPRTCVTHHVGHNRSGPMMIIQPLVAYNLFLLNMCLNTTTNAFQNNLDTMKHLFYIPSLLAVATSTIAAPPARPFPSAASSPSSGSSASSALDCTQFTPAGSGNYIVNPDQWGQVSSLQRWFATMERSMELA